MGLIGKLVAAIEFKAGGDVFHQMLRHKSESFSPNNEGKIEGFDLHEGQFGHVGAITSWRFNHDGKAKIVKEVIQKIDEEQKLIEYKVIGGYLVEEYKAFVITTHVETKGDVDLATWTLEYEMFDEGGEHPMSLLSFVIDATNDMAALVAK